MRIIHNEIFNTDYYIIGTYEAKKWLGDQAFDVIGIIKEYEEDNFGEADLPLAVLPSTEEVVLMQMDGELTPDEFEEAFNMAIEGCKQVYEIQRDALKRRYGGK